MIAGLRAFAQAGLQLRERSQPSSARSQLRGLSQPLRPGSASPSHSRQVMLAESRSPDSSCSPARSPERAGRRHRDLDQALAAAPSASPSAIRSASALSARRCPACVRWGPSRASATMWSATSPGSISWNCMAPRHDQERAALEQRAEERVEQRVELRRAEDCVGRAGASITFSPRAWRVVRVLHLLDADDRDVVEVADAGRLRLVEQSPVPSTSILRVSLNGLEAACSDDVDAGDGLLQARRRSAGRPAPTRRRRRRSIRRRGGS